jgi:hypothetical protein
MPIASGNPYPSCVIARSEATWQSQLSLKYKKKYRQTQMLRKLCMTKEGKENHPVLRTPLRRRGINCRNDGRGDYIKINFYFYLILFIFQLFYYTIALIFLNKGKYKNEV